MMTTWGAISTQGSQADLNTTRFSAAICCYGCGLFTLVGFFKTHQQFVAPFDNGVQRFLGRLFAGQDVFELFVLDVADLNIVAQLD